jgi:uncharacterized protein DUF6636
VKRPLTRLGIFLPLAILTATSFAIATAHAGTSSTFRTPSRNIACGYFARSSFNKRAYLRCDVLSGLKRPPRRSCPGDWVGASMTAAGRAGAVCAGDTVYDNRAPILRYGRTWRLGGFICVSRTTGLTCRNRTGHGFLLARERWRVF